MQSVANTMETLVNHTTGVHPEDGTRLRLSERIRHDDGLPSVLSGVYPYIHMGRVLVEVEPPDLAMGEEPGQILPLYGAEPQVDSDQSTPRFMGGDRAQEL
jgi:hypothetical protein